MGDPAGAATGDHPSPDPPSADPADPFDPPVFAPRAAEAPDTEVHTGEHVRHHGTAAVIVAVLVAVAAAGASGAAGLVTSSAAALAAAGQWAAAAITVLLVAAGGRRSRAATEAGHPLGYERARYFWFLVIGIASHGAATALAVVLGVVDLRDPGGPPALDRPEVAAAALGAATALGGASLGATLAAIGRAAGSASTWQFVRRARRAELPVAFLAGLGAIVGSVAALAGVGASMALDDARGDRIGSLAVAATATATALGLLWALKRLLVGPSAPRRRIEAVQAAAEVEPEVLRVIHLRVQHVGPDELLVAAKVEVLDDLSLGEVAATLDRIQANIREHVPEARIVYLEPALAGDHHLAEGYVTETVGHLDRDDPDYARLTGQHPIIRPGDEPAGAAPASVDDDDIWS